ncbi:uncharacterized protein Fot_01163 [Forsythia ovata]|uniref:Cyclin-dependent kinases regulatory subunit n=1 Tax=Forsythia ovata TaxID=205694 RepID=A0ABD1X374_9LAMI
MSIKGAEGNTFQKNCVEFNLYEPRRDKTVKGQLLGTAILDLADYGVVKESLSINAPINCKRTYRNTTQPLLFLKIQPFEKSRTSSSSRDNLTGEASMDKNHGESISALMSEEYAEEAEVSTFTDDDISSHSSMAASSVVELIGYSSPQDKEYLCGGGGVAPQVTPGLLPPVPAKKKMGGGDVPVSWAKYTFECRHVVLPPEVAKLFPNNRLLSENEWCAIGVQQSCGWVHYAVHHREPHIMLFRRPLNYQQQKENQAPQIPDNLVLEKHAWLVTFRGMDRPTPTLRLVFFELYA